MTGAISSVTSLVTEKTISESVLDDALWGLELVLLENNVASEVTEKIVSEIKEKLAGKSVKRGDIQKIIAKTLKDNVKEALDQEPFDLESKIKEAKKEGRPALFIFIGFNGSGKTTSIAKLAHMLKKNGHSVVMAAGDSFRAAAIEQIEHHGEKLGIPVIKHQYGADPAAVIFDAVKYAGSHGADVVLADTAGRVHTDKNLMEELRKIVRVNSPDGSILVVESVTGNEVVEQAKMFGELGLAGIILSKWDIDEKGGAALSLCHTLKRPILYLGIGQEYGDFEKFEVEKAIENII